ncbi:MAG: PH domain-containing protein [Actinomycetota bacterium]|jgi:uncharacterized membrane protein YdbT with pleckstrin-like domain
MSFSQKNLNPNETIALDMHPHWWYFAGPAVALVGALVFEIFVLTLDKGDTRDVLGYLALALIVFTAVWLVARYLKWTTTYFVITSHRLIFRTGVIAKSGVEIPLERVNNVNFNQGIFERILGAGDLLIESGGEDGQSRFSDIRHPDRVQRLIHAQMEQVVKRRAGYAHPSAPAGAVDVAEQLERLEGMMQRGTLSAEEFEAQKRKLLGT